jgi:hypothetical protein
MSLAKFRLALVLLAVTALAVVTVSVALPAYDAWRDDQRAEREAKAAECAPYVGPQGQIVKDYC